MFKLKYVKYEIQKLLIDYFDDNTTWLANILAYVKNTNVYIGNDKRSTNNRHKQCEGRFNLKYEPPRDKTNIMACAPSEDSDQPGHPPSLTRVFAIRMKKAWVLSYPLSAQRRL